MLQGIHLLVMLYIFIYVHQCPTRFQYQITCTFVSFKSNTIILAENLSSFTPGFHWGSCCSIFSFLCNVLQMVVCLCLFLWPLCCLPFFGLRLLISPLVSSNFSNRYRYHLRCAQYGYLLEIYWYRRRNPFLTSLYFKYVYL